MSYMKSLLICIVVIMSTSSGNNNEFSFVTTQLATKLTLSQKNEDIHVYIDLFDKVGILGRHP